MALLGNKYEILATEVGFYNVSLAWLYCIISPIIRKPQCIQFFKSVFLETNAPINIRPQYPLLGRIGEQWGI